MKGNTTVLISQRGRCLDIKASKANLLDLVSYVEISFLSQRPSLKLSEQVKAQLIHTEEEMDSSKPSELFEDIVFGPSQSLAR